MLRELVENKGERSALVRPAVANRIVCSLKLLLSPKSTCESFLFFISVVFFLGKGQAKTRTHTVLIWIKTEFLVWQTDVIVALRRQLIVNAAAANSIAAAVAKRSPFYRDKAKKKEISKKKNQSCVRLSFCQWPCMYVAPVLGRQGAYY